jgi:hypothetical protein
MRRVIVGVLGALAVSFPQPGHSNDCGYYGGYSSGYSYSSYYPSYPTVEYRDRVVYRDVYRDVYQPVAVPVPYTVQVPTYSYAYNAGAYAPIPTVAAQPAVGIQQTGYSAGMTGAVVAPQVVAAQSGVAQTVTQGIQSAQVQQVQQGVATAPQTMEFSDALVDKLIQRIEQRLQSRTGAAVPQQTAPAQPSGSIESIPPARIPGSTSQVTPQGGDLSTRVASILSTNRTDPSKSCIECHKGPDARGGIMIFTENGQLNPTVDREAVFEAADTGKMPPGANKNIQLALTDEDVAVLEQWKNAR